MKSFRAHQPTGGLSADGNHRPGRRFSSRAGGRHRHNAVAEHLAAARPPVWLTPRVRAVDELPSRPRAFIFDVEGTLVDNVLATLQCWSETLADIGFAASVADLHPFSGMDAKHMLRRLLKKHDPKLIDHIVKLQSERYRLRYLPHTRPFPGLRHVFTIIKDADAKIALATSCEKAEFAHYRAIMNVDDLIDNACCGDDLKRQKLCADVVSLAAKKLRLPAEEIAMIGDTPADAEAARAAGLLTIGVQSGHFSRSDLLDAGCAAVFFDLQALAQKLPDQAPAAAADIRSHIAAAADSH